MSRGPLKFKQTDITRAVKAVAAAGVEIREVVIDANGAIRLIAGKAPSVLSRVNEWDAVYDEAAS